jgi:hypothetical protein
MWYVSDKRWHFYTALICKPDVIRIPQRTADIVDFCVKYLLFLLYIQRNGSLLKMTITPSTASPLWDDSAPRSIADLGTDTYQLPQTILMLLLSVGGGSGAVVENCIVSIILRYEQIGFK